MQVGHGQHRAHLLGRLQIVQLDIAQTFGQPLQLGPVGPFAADHKADVAAVLQQPCRLDQDLDALFAGDIARIERDNLAGQVPRGADRSGASRISGEACVGPVTHFEHAARLHPFGDQFGAHLRANGRDMVAQLQQGGFDPAGQFGRQGGWFHQAGGERRFNFKVLNVNPQLGPSQPRRQPGCEHAEQGRSDGDDNIRLLGLAAQRGVQGER